MALVLVAAWALPQDVLVQAGFVHSVETCRLVLVPVPALLQDHALVGLGPSLQLSDWVHLHPLVAVVQAHLWVGLDECLGHMEPVQILAFLAYLGLAPAVVALAASEDAPAAFVV